VQVFDGELAEGAFFEVYCQAGMAGEEDGDQSAQVGLVANQDDVCQPAVFAPENLLGHDHAQTTEQGAEAFERLARRGQIFQASVVQSEIEAVAPSNPKYSKTQR
jgi:hypothetical protein